jgi:hypothetical protein
VDLTATAMHHTGGQVLVALVGAGLAIGGLVMAWSAARSKFLKKLNTHEMSARAQQVVTWIGRIGGVARGVIFIVSGVFLVIAAVKYQPQQAKGVTLRPRSSSEFPRALSLEAELG